MQLHRGVWIWVLDKLSPDYLSKLKSQNIKTVYLKVGDDASADVFWSFQCTPKIIQALKSAGVEKVIGWSYIFDRCSQTSEKQIFEMVKASKIAGCDGHVFDVEVEVKNATTHPQLKRILIDAQKVFPGMIGYTSLGHPGFHPEIPWVMLNDNCDFQCPQIYVEKFGFGEGKDAAARNLDEVYDCITAHQKLNLNKPIFPIFSSESDAEFKIPTAELQNLVSTFEGSSVWRAPNRGEFGRAWEINYKSEINSQPKPKVPELPDRIGKPLTKVDLPMSSRELALGDSGAEVYELQCLLIELGPEISGLRKPNEGELLGDQFNTIVDYSVRRFQSYAKIESDGIVGPETRRTLERFVSQARNPSKPAQKSSFDGKAFANFCENDLQKVVTWFPQIKYVQPFVSQLGKQRWAWCGATMYWCLNEFLFKANGKSMPLRYPGEMTHTFALVESWQEFAKSRGWYKDNTAGYVPPAGAIVMFDWDQSSINEVDRDWEDHIGCFLRMEGGQFVCAEGNANNKTGIRLRDRSTIQGFMIIPDGTMP